jgi:hypothetical protein
MLFLAGNFARPTTAAPTAVTTGTAIKTMLQVATPATREFSVVKWSISLTASPTAPITCELIQTDVGATITQHVAAGIQPYNRPNGTPVSTALIASTTQTGYTATAEGTTTASRYGDLQVIPAGVSQLTWEWSLGREFVVAPSTFLRVRVTTGTAANMLTYCLWDE